MDDLQLPEDASTGQHVHLPLSLASERSRPHSLLQADKPLHFVWANYFTALPVTWVSFYSCLHTTSPHGGSLRTELRLCRAPHAGRGSANRRRRHGPASSKALCRALSLVKLGPVTCQVPELSKEVHDITTFTVTVRLSRPPEQSIPLRSPLSLQPCCCV